MPPILRSLLILIALGFSAAQISAADAVFVTNPSGPDSISSETVRNILLGNKTRWDSGGTIKLAVLSEGTTHESVIQEFTARSADQFNKYWKKQVFTGKGIAPDAFKTDEELIEFVARTPGAFGYVSPNANATGVKIMSVQ